MSHKLIMDGHLGGCVMGGDEDTYDEKIWDILIDRYVVKSIIDVGCGEGWSTNYFKSKGIDTIGIEGSQKVIDGSPFKDLLICHDFTKSSFVPQKQYDAIWTCEFVEHVEERYADNFLTTFSSANYVFMTYSEPQWSGGGYHHVNCRNQEYWNSHMERYGFVYKKDESLELRSIAKARWVKPTLSIYCKGDIK